MNEIIKSIMTRRSIRSFTDKAISREDLEAIVGCARFAPSAMNRQQWKFTVIQNKELIAKLAKAVGTVIGRGDDYNFYKPNALILITAPRDYGFGVQDCSCAAENVFLSAHALGIGSVWINQLCGVSDEPILREMLNELNVPSDHVVYSTAALGYPANAASEPVKRADNAEFFL